MEWLVVRKLTAGGKIVMAIILWGLFLLVGFRFDFYFILFPLVAGLTIVTIGIEVWRTPQLKRACLNFIPFLRIETTRIIFRRQILFLFGGFLLIGSLSAVAYLKYQPQSQEAFVANQAEAVRTILNHEQKEATLPPKFTKLLTEHEQLTNRLYSLQIMDNFTEFAATQTQQLKLEQRLRQKYPQAVKDGTLNFMRSEVEGDAQLAINRQLIKHQIVLDTKNTTALNHLSQWLPLILLLASFISFFLASDIASVDQKHATLYRGMPNRSLTRILGRSFLYQLLTLLLIGGSLLGYFAGFGLLGEIGDWRNYFAIYWLDSFKVGHFGFFLGYGLLYLLALNFLLYFSQALLSRWLKRSELATILLLSLVAFIGLFSLLGNTTLNSLNFLFFPLILLGTAKYGYLVSLLLVIGLSGIVFYLLKKFSYETRQRGDGR